MTDIHFDGIAETFNSTIYETSKGYIRLGVLWEDLSQAVPGINKRQLSILDVGGGMGQIALQLAHLGHELTLADPSKDMLDKAREVIKRERLENITVVHSDAQSLAQHIDKTFDLVMCHAVLEWVASPREVISALENFIKPKGNLSLMFLNQNARIFKSALRGDFQTYSSVEKANSAEQSLPEASGSTSLTGARGLQAESIIQLLDNFGFKVQSKAGIRVFHDYISEHLKQEQLSALLEMEKNFRNVEPFASLGQHTHLVCCRAVT